MKQTKRIQDIVRPIQVIGWSLGSGIIEYPKGHPQYLITILYSLAILSLYTVSLIYTIANEKKLYFYELNKTGKVMIQIILLGNAFVALISIILAWNRRKELKKCIRNIKMVDELLKKIGISKECEEVMKREIINLCATVLIIAITMIINSLAIAKDDTEGHIRAFMIISANYPLALVFVSDIIFLILVRCMNRKFSKLNDLLKSMSSTSQLSPQYMKLLYHKSDILKTNIPEFNKKTNDDKKLMKAAKQVHLDLVKISRNISDIFGLQILSSVAVSLVFITGLLYFSYTVIYKSTMDQKIKIWGLISSSCWLFMYVMKILAINHICDRTSAEALRTGSIICELHEPTTSKEFRSEIREFVLQLIQNPLKFTAYEFLSLDYTLIQGIVGTITTYLVILIQLSTGTDETDNRKQMCKSCEEKIV